MTEQTIYMQARRQDAEIVHTYIESYALNVMIML